MAFVMTEAIGLWAAFFPHAWLMRFDSDPATLAAGALHLRVVGRLAPHAVVAGEKGLAALTAWG